LEDPRFNSAQARRVNNVELIALMDGAIVKHDLAHWTRVFKEHDLVWGPVPSSVEVAADPQLMANGIFAEITPDLKTVMNPINVQGAPKVAPRMAPEVGQHTREVLSGAGYSEDAITAMIARGAALAGD
jgi:crotonobetainyl-CoA:carnitine CoA-transferase CaiB-like acyl-CoA transferase